MHFVTHKEIAEAQPRLKRIQSENAQSVNTNASLKGAPRSRHRKTSDGRRQSGQNIAHIDTRKDHLPAIENFGKLLIAYSKFVARQSKDSSNVRCQCRLNSSVTSLCPECFQRKKKQLIDFFGYMRDEDPALYRFFENLSLNDYMVISQTASFIVPMIPDIFLLQSEWCQQIAAEAV